MKKSTTEFQKIRNLISKLDEYYKESVHLWDSDFYSFPRHITKKNLEKVASIIFRLSWELARVRRRLAVINKKISPLYDNQFYARATAQLRSIEKSKLKKQNKGNEVSNIA